MNKDDFLYPTASLRSSRISPVTVQKDGSTMGRGNTWPTVEFKAIMDGCSLSSKWATSISRRAFLPCVA